MEKSELEEVRSELQELKRLITEKRETEYGVLSLEEAAKRLDVSPRTLRRMAKEGQILLVTIGKKEKVPLSEMRRLTTPVPMVEVEQFPKSRPSKRQLSPAEEAARIRAAMRRD